MVIKHTRWKSEIWQVELWRNKDGNRMSRIEDGMRIILVGFTSDDV